MAMPVLPILLLPLTMAVSDTLPNFSTEPTCRGGLTDPKDNARYEQCLKEEAAAKATLAAGWTKYPAADRETCSATARMGTPSYVEMLTCLQMDADLREMKYKPK
jgi:hypothetical protein